MQCTLTTDRLKDSRNGSATSGSANSLRWHCHNFDGQVDETYVKVCGEWAYLYRALDKHGNAIDFYLSPRHHLVSIFEFADAESQGSLRNQGFHQFQRVCIVSLISRKSSVAGVMATICSRPLRLSDGCGQKLGIDPRLPGGGLYPEPNGVERG